MASEDSNFTQTSSTSKLPVSRLPMSTAKKHVSISVADDEYDSIVGVVVDEPRPKIARMDSNYANFSSKAVAVVKPALSYQQTFVKPLASKNTMLANKLKRRSMGLLNKPTQAKKVFYEKNAASHSRQQKISINQKPPIVATSNGRGVRQHQPKPTTFVQQRKVSSGNSVRVSNGSNASGSSSAEHGDLLKTKKASSRPGWDIKGRLSDMENEMKNYKSETVCLRDRMVFLERQNVQLESTAQQKQQISQEAFAQADDLRQKLNTQTMELDQLRNKFSLLERENRNNESELENFRFKCQELTKQLTELTTFQMTATIQLETTKSKLSESLAENDVKSSKIVDLEHKLQQTEEKNRNLEMIRRKLHNNVQELKGNIRVFCRVRPLLPNECAPGEEFSFRSTHIKCSNDDPTKLEIFKDDTLNESSMQIPNKSNNNMIGKRPVRHDFEFDRVFDVDADQMTIFEEISQLIQSAIDGYNVCIFAYGQTGSGKTYTMQGPELDVLRSHPESAGVIPLAARQIFTTANDLSSKGWQYTFQASYLEIYNEKVRDLLMEENNEDQDLDIKLASHNPNNSSAGSKANEVVIPDLTVKSISNEDQLNRIIEFAVEKRAKASTKCNLRSSRSHSVFRLKISGKNSVTGVSCDGLLSLVDLAGSERLKESQSEGDRLKEAQNINKSLSALGQVITGLSQKDSHISYRNSRLTYLLQNSLGGNSKTLMFVNISPNEKHLNETINSLKFAAKVNQCHIGSAYKKV